MKDLLVFEKDLQKSIEAYIEQILQSNFVGLEKIIGEYAKKPEDGDENEEGLQLQDLSNINTKQLETVAQDFTFTYKQKADSISKVIRQDLTHGELI